MAASPENPEIPEPADLQEIRLEEAFWIWVRMGESRTFKAIADQLELPISTVVRHSKKFRWTDQLKKATRQAAQRTMSRMVEAVADINERHVGELRELREKALLALRNLTISHPRDAIKLFSEVLKMERQILGVDENADKNDIVAMLEERMRSITHEERPQLPEDTKAEAEPEPEHEFELEEGAEEPLDDDEELQE